MKESATVEAKRTGIVLGLYIAALLLAGPLHPLFHEGSLSAAEPKCDDARPVFAFGDVHAGDYTLHSCPACFLNSHPAVGADFSTADIDAKFESADIAIVESEVVTHVAHSPISSRAPPYSL